LEKRNEKGLPARGRVNQFTGGKLHGFQTFSVFVFRHDPETFGKNLDAILIYDLPHGDLPADKPVENSCRFGFHGTI